MTRTTPRHDVLILGGGVMGAATALALARRGRRTLLVERFAPGHDHGSSHGDGRIIRTTYPEPIYLEMARRAAAAWRSLEAASGTRLVERTGSFECGPAGAPQLAELVAGFTEHGIAHERLDAAESARRFPQFRLPEGSEAIVQSDGGIVRAGRAVETLWRLAADAGAELRAETEIVDVEIDATRARLREVGGTFFEADVLVVTAGGWASRWLGELGLDVPLVVTREHVAYFPPKKGKEAAHRIGGLPVFVDYHTPETPFYALPQIDVPGVKVGLHRSGVEIDPDAPPELSDASLVALRDAVAQRFPDLENEPISQVGCLYTSTPDYHFVLDQHRVLDRPPEIPRLVVGAGFSGHGFKFAPVIGEILADLATGTEPAIDLETFRLARFAPGAGSLERRTSA